MGAGPISLSMSRLTCRAVRSGGMAATNEFWCIAPSMGGAVARSSFPEEGLKSGGAGGMLSMLAGKDGVEMGAGARCLSLASAAPSPSDTPPEPRVPTASPLRAPAPVLAPRAMPATRAASADIGWPLPGMFLSISSVDCRAPSDSIGNIELSNVSWSCVPCGPAAMWFSIAPAMVFMVVDMPAPPLLDTCLWNAVAPAGSWPTGGMYAAMPGASLGTSMLDLRCASRTAVMALSVTSFLPPPSEVT
mmetsp:Transcript_2021/g.8048  ORF Transcript_2021/g.8048 Transcript_2021/m.8048 type:complete len:247 (-) Transcript_2021:1402-2142(-)